MGRRSSGGVSIVDMSRMPPSAIYRVRGMGVAESVRTSTSRRIFLRCSLWDTPNRCSLVDDDEAGSFEGDVLLDQAVRANDDVDGAFGQLFDDHLLLGVRTEAGQHLNSHREGGQPLAECLGVAAQGRLWARAPPLAYRPSRP